jgi:uncharacterized membrane protein YkgB
MMKTIQTKTRLGDLYDRLDRSITYWMASYGLTILRLSLGVVFLWFGALKLAPGTSPAEALVRSTIYFVDPDIFLPVLALWEMLIGAGLLTRKFLRLTLLLLFAQMVGTALPLVVLPQVVWTDFPFILTLEGQYIIKNLVIIGSAIVLGGTVRGGRLVPEPEAG